MNVVYVELFKSSFVIENVLKPEMVESPNGIFDYGSQCAKAGASEHLT